MDSIELELLKIEKGHLATDYKIYLHRIELERNALINKLAEDFQNLGETNAEIQKKQLAILEEFDKNVEVEIGSFKRRMDNLRMREENGNISNMTLYFSRPKIVLPV